MKVGDYVRTKNGYIDRIKKIDVEDHERGDDEGEKPYEIYELKNKYFDEEFNETSCWVFEDFIKKSSPNIIDLIEIGDIVNYGLIGGGMVLHKKNDEITTNALLFGILKNKDIKSVITREQIESNLYKLEVD